MQGKDFLFFIIDTQGRSYFVENGIVKTQTLPKPLQFSPDGWQKLAISWERNNKYYGVVRNFTLPLSFVQDGATIISSIFYNKNIDEKIYLLVHKNTLEIDAANDEFSFVYRYMYKGEIDLSTFVQNSITEGGKVQVNIMEGGASKFLKSRESITYEIPCNSSAADCVPIRFDGINYRSTLNFSNFEYDFGTNTFYNAGLVYINEEGDSYGVYKTSQTPEGLAGGQTLEDYLTNSNNYFLYTEKEFEDDLVAVGTFQFKTGSPVSVSGNNAVHLRLYTLDDTGTRIWIELATDTKPPNSTSDKLEFSVTVPKTFIAKKRKIFLMTFNFATLSGASTITILGNKFSLRTVTKLASSIVYAKRPLNLFEQLCSKISDNSCNGISTILADNFNKVAISGNAIRQLPTATIKTSMQDFFAAYNVLLNLGLSTTDTEFLIEEKPKYFNALQTIVELGIVKNLKVSIAKEYVGNSLKIGYPNQSSIVTTNGKEEFNNTHLYQLPVNRVTKEINLVSPYRTDGYGIEQIRFQTQQTEKVSNPSDNDTFIVEIEDVLTTIDGVAAYNVKKLPNTAVITGLFAEDTAYNIGLSPKRLFRVHNDFIHSILSNYAGQKITFQTTEQNALLKTVDSGVTYQENADVTIGDAFYFNKPKLFQPVIFEFDAESPINLIETLEANPFVQFSFAYNGNPFKGFLMKAGVDAATNEEQQFTLLSHPDNNLKLLING